MTQIIRQNRHKQLNVKLAPSRPRIPSTRRFDPKPHQPNFDQLDALRSIALRSCTCGDSNCALKCDCVQLAEISERKSALIKLGVVVEQTALEALVDSGASNNYMSKAAFDRFAHSAVNLTFTPSTHKVQIADQSMVSSSGYVDVDLIIDDRSIRTTFTVLDNLSFDIILGTFFLRANHVVIDADDGDIHFKEKEESTCKITLIEDLIVPAHSQVVALVRANTTFTNFNFIRNTPKFVNQHGVHLAQGIIDPKTPTFQILLSNLTNECKIVAAETTVGEGLFLPSQEYDLDCVHVLEEHEEKTKKECPSHQQPPTEISVDYNQDN